MNSVKKRSEESVDICTYDVEKCFDALWSYECINNLCEKLQAGTALQHKQNCTNCDKNFSRNDTKSPNKEHHNARHSVGVTVMYCYHGQAAQDDA